MHQRLSPFSGENHGKTESMRRKYGRKRKKKRKKSKDKKDSRYQRGRKRFCRRQTLSSCCLYFRRLHRRRPRPRCRSCLSSLTRDRNGRRSADYRHKDIVIAVAQAIETVRVAAAAVTTALLFVGRHDANGHLFVSAAGVAPGRRSHGQCWRRVFAAHPERAGGCGRVHGYSSVMARYRLKRR